MPEKFQTKYSAEEIEALLDKVNSGDIPTGNTDNGIKVKKVFLDSDGEHGMKLHIISHSISDKIVNLIKTTDKVRLRFGDITNKAHRRKHYYSWSTRTNWVHNDGFLSPEQQADYLYFHCPQITEDDLIIGEDETYIHKIIDLIKFTGEKVGTDNPFSILGIFNHNKDVVNDEYTDHYLSYRHSHSLPAASKSRRDVNTSTIKKCKDLFPHWAPDFYRPTYTVWGLANHVMFNNAQLHKDSILRYRFCKGLLLRIRTTRYYQDDYDDILPIPTDINEWNNILNNQSGHWMTRGESGGVLTCGYYRYDDGLNKYGWFKPINNDITERFRIGFGILKDDYLDIENKFFWEKRYPYSNHLVMCNYEERYIYNADLDEPKVELVEFWTYSLKNIPQH